MKKKEEQMKAQSSMEAALLMTFMTLSLVLFLAVAADKISQSYENRDKQQLQDLAVLIEAELKLAAASENGYHRNIELPLNLEGKRYSAELFGPERIKLGTANAEHTEIVLKYDNNHLPTYEYVIYLAKNINGTFCYGYNSIVKELNKVNVTCNCPSGYQDKDGDNYTVGNKKIFCNETAIPTGHRGAKSSYEDCDDGNPAVGPCKRVFVTSTTYNGNLGGLSGADAKCMARASAAILNGTYKAWISDSTTDVSTRMAQSSVPYVLLDGSYSQVAANWAALISGSISTPIRYNELGNIVSANPIPYVWTGTDVGGGRSPPYCIDWNGTSGQGRVGSALETNNAWTFTTPKACDNNYRLYCFEQ